MKKILVAILALVIVLSLAAAAFAAASPVTPPAGGGTGAGAVAGVGGGAGAGVDKVAKPAPIVKFSTGETKKGTPVEAPYTDEVKAAIELADKVVKGIEDASEELKAFFEENEGALAVGIITMGEDAAEGSVKLAVSAKGFDKVVFNAPGDAEGLGFVVLEG